MKTLSNLKIDIYADGADLGGMMEMAQRPYVRGFTTNPTLMRKSGVGNYEAFAKEVVKAIVDRPISFEVFTDEFAEMEVQALKIASWGDNVNVKIPVTNTKGEPAYPLIQRLSSNGVKLNVTAIFTLDQVKRTAVALAQSPWSIISVFAGRIADSGRDPMPIMRAAKASIAGARNVKLLWASTRELLNVIQAEESDCDIITVTNDIIKKFDGLGKGLDEFSLETVKMFYDDAKAAGFRI